MKLRVGIAAVFVAAAIAVTFTALGAAQKRQPFDHSLYTQVLRAHVRDGKVDYRALKAQDARKLGRYLQLLCRADAKGFVNRDDALAFWLNAYNASAIQGVLERYPKIKSVQDVKGFFDDKRWFVAGRKRSLNEIENQIIRPEFRDPRVHLVLVCAAQSCPPRQPYAMLGDGLQQKLERVTRQVVNDDQHVQIDPKTKRLRLTRIMSWYKQDFVDRYGSLEDFLLRYLDEPKRSQLKAGGYTVEFMPYDWSLNDAGSAASKRSGR
jgi:hypothetical protein